MTHHLFDRKQAGDTIVEVIIAVAVVSSVLIGAYTVTNRSVQAVRDSEEHAQALQWLQGQVELLRQAALTKGFLTFPFTSAFCLGTPSGVMTRYGAAAPECLAGGLYQLQITGPGSAPTCAPLPSSLCTTSFNLQATWPAVSGGYSTVYLSYKVNVH